MGDPLFYFTPPIVKKKFLENFVEFTMFVKMNKQILRKYRTLGEYHSLTVPKLNTPESMKFYDRNKSVIDFECEMYSQIHNDRGIMGGNKIIHKIKI